jgi:hypothetical protein
MAASCRSAYASRASSSKQSNGLLTIAAMIAVFPAARGRCPAALALTLPLLF